MSRDLKDAAYGELARLGKALGHPHRLELVDLLAQGPRTVERLAEGTARSVASTSQHLQTLAAARLVTRTRLGQHIEYALADGVAELAVVLRRAGRGLLAELDVHRARALGAWPDVRSVEAEEVREQLARGEALLLDVRPRSEFEHGHISGARSVPLEELDVHIAGLPEGIRVVACCRGPWCTWADEAVERLIQAGFEARRLEGGVHDWKLEGGDVVGGTG